MASALTFGGGALMGFASSLHCVGMCGGIALLLGMPAGQGGGLRAALSHLPLHGGRALSYMILGGLAGSLGGAAISAVQIDGAHLLMRWAAAMALAWVGLSTLGLMPSPALIGHALLPRAVPVWGRGNVHAGFGRFAAGLGWGLLPCGMVYGALLYAAFAGSALGGMVVMAGFATGTLPALLLVQGGSSTFIRFARRKEARVATGILVLLLALASLLPEEANLLAACGNLAFFR